MVLLFSVVLVALLRDAQQSIARDLPVAVPKSAKMNVKALQPKGNTSVS